MIRRAIADCCFNFNSLDNDDDCYDIWLALADNSVVESCKFNYYLKNIQMAKSKWSVNLIFTNNNKE